MSRQEDVYVFLSVYDGVEGPVHMWAADIGQLPLFTTQEKALDLLRAVAQRAARAENRTIVLARFSNRQDMEIIDPSGRSDRFGR